jgi:16S rRNA G1207 methylase RsmC|tara:strand:+ start:6910 stop:8088 length:1179 start_codon:yes stop_codon:yes gene_type:complete
VETLASAFGSYSLQRIPLRTKETLRAWDAGDEYLLQVLSGDDNVPSENARILIINDQFGALATSLNKYDVTCWGDSYLGELSTAHNFAINNIDSNTILIASTNQPSGIFNIVVIKVPKTLALLEQQLITLQNHIDIDTTIIAGGMVKNIHNSTIALFKKYIGPTVTSLAKKKARLIHPNYANKSGASSPYPTDYLDETTGLILSNNANVFSRENLDIGARFMLEQFEKLPLSQHIIDLGCGNGILGVMAKKSLPECKITFIDESYMALDSAKTNYIAALNNDLNASFVIADSLTDITLDKPDLILCNPPFHQHNTVGDHIAWRMISQSYKALKRGGQLWVIGNRQLSYHSKIERLFGNCKTIAANKKFVVLVGTKGTPKQPSTTDPWANAKL